MKSNETEADKQAVRDAGNAQQNAFNRMKRAYDRGTGCHLSADMITALSVTIIGSIWDEADPRRAPGEGLANART